MNILGHVRRHGFSAIKRAKPYTLPLLKAANRSAGHALDSSRRLEFWLQWETDDPPEWFDHSFDDWQLRVTGNAIGTERGVFGHLALRPGDRVLDVCCGDGFATRYWWSPRAREVVAIDVDEAALAHARRHHASPKISYLACDVAAESLPKGPFDVVMWHAAIEHFAESEIETILRRIEQALTADGVLVGTTLVHRESGTYMWHKREFVSKEDLADVLARTFAHVTVTESPHESRNELLFYCSNSPTRIPFRSENTLCDVRAADSHEFTTARRP